MMTLRGKITSSLSDYLNTSPQEKKRKKIVETANGPVLPKLCRVWFICAVVLSFLMAVVDVVNYFRYTPDKDAAVMLGNSGKTGFISLLCFLVVLVPLCVVSIVRIRHNPSLAEDEGTGVVKKYSPYSKYLIVCLGEIAFFGILFLFNIM